MDILKRSSQAMVVLIGDLHINSTVALCPERFEMDDGGIYKPSKAQRWLWDCWLEFWSEVKKRKGRKRLYVVIGGDIVDVNQHSQTQLIVFENNAAILDAAEKVLKLPRMLADHIFVIRGTEAHTGGSGYLEEQLAQRIGAEKDVERFSWWHLAMEIEGVKFDLAHHPQTAARRPWTRESSAARQAAITWSEYHEMGEVPPDIVGRWHVHYWAKGYKGSTFCFYGPPWQLATSFGYRLGTGRKIEPVGGVVVVAEKGRTPLWEDIRYSPPRGNIWKR